MSKSVKKWLRVENNLGKVCINGTASERKKGQQGNDECWLALTPREADWLIQQIYDAMPEGTRGVAVVKVRR